MNTSHFIPILTTEQGMTLTANDWQSAQVNLLSCYLASLLIKPGIDILEKMPGLGKYWGWDGQVVLNMTMPAIGSDGIYKLKSPIDGRRFEITYETLFSLIPLLKPQYVILPKETRLESLEQLLADFPEIPLFLPQSEWLTTPYKTQLGIYSELREGMLDKMFQQETKYYLTSDLTIGQIRSLKNPSVHFIESNRPAYDARLGCVYDGDLIIDLTDKQYAHDFNVIDPECQCLTCTQRFTRAYLHHLFSQTPLLCQRLLMQHNIYCCATTS